MSRNTERRIIMKDTENDKRVLFFDTETSGLPKYKDSYMAEQPWVVQLGMVLSTRYEIHARSVFLIKPNGRKITAGAFNVHKINEATAEKYGISEMTACYIFLELLLNSDMTSCHNVVFDKLLTAHLLYNNGFVDEADYLWKFDAYCTMTAGTNMCMIPQKGKFAGKRWKWPKLQELHKHLFGEEFTGAHDALADIEATRRCYYKMIKER